MLINIMDIVFRIVLLLFMFIFSILAFDEEEPQHGANMVTIAVCSMLAYCLMTVL